jgi:hypothetical protein
VEAWVCLFATILLSFPPTVGVQGAQPRSHVGSKMVHDRSRLENDISYIVPHVYVVCTPWLLTLKMTRCLWIFPRLTRTLHPPPLQIGELFQLCGPRHMPPVLRAAEQDERPGQIYHELMSSAPACRAGSDWTELDRVELNGIASIPSHLRRTPDSPAHLFCPALPYHTVSV